MLKICIIGDPHFKISNIQNVDLFTQKLLEKLEKDPPDLIICLGDVLDEHERLHITPLNRATEFLKALSSISLTYVLVGNHDMLNNKQYLNSNHWMNSLKSWENLIVIDKPDFLLIEGFRFCFCPYVPPGKFVDALNTIKGEWEKSDIIFAHQEFRGCKMGAIISEEGDPWNENLPFVISGHIHSNQKIGGNIYYPGASMQHAFGESSKNIIAFLNIPEEVPTNFFECIYEIDLGLPRKKIVYDEVLNFDEIKMENLTKGKGNENDEIKLTLSGTYEEYKNIQKSSKFKELTENGIKIVYKQKRVEKKEHANCLKGLSEKSDFMEILQDLVEKTKNGKAKVYLNHIFFDGDKDEDLILI
jgi:DNA repair exonuclease SbcCD nuclease subunit